MTELSNVLLWMNEAGDIVIQSSISKIGTLYIINEMSSTRWMAVDVSLVLITPLSPAGRQIVYAVDSIHSRNELKYSL